MKKNKVELKVVGTKMVEEKVKDDLEKAEAEFCVAKLFEEEEDGITEIGSENDRDNKQDS